MRGGRRTELIGILLLLYFGVVIGVVIGYQIGKKQNIDRQTVIEYQLDRAEERYEAD